MDLVPSLKPPAQLELRIEDLAFGGEGIGKVQSNDKLFTIFVEDTVPGDVVIVQIFQKKKNWARGFVTKMITPSKLRIKPRCPHFGDIDRRQGCGGCTLQYVSAEQQLRFKEQQVRDALKRIGGVQEDVVLPILGMKDPWFYRNKMEFSFHLSPEQKLDLGLHLKRRHYDLVELEECFLLGTYVGEFVKEARVFFRKLVASGTVDPELTLNSLTIREGKNTGEIMIIVTAENGSENFMEDFRTWVLSFFEKKNLKLTSLSFVHILNKPGKPKIQKEYLFHGQTVIHEELHLADGQILKFQISPLAFFQPNTKQAEVLYSKVLAAAGLTGEEIVYDLFCGTGTIGIFCAQKARKVYGIELNASAVKNARQNAALNSISNIDFWVGDVGNALQALPEKPDIVIVDPPRNGLEPKVVEKVARLKAKRMVYVSCNPTTLARDAALFTKTGYRLESVQPVDMFPQTYHIENVALFSKTFL